MKRHPVEDKQKPDTRASKPAWILTLEVVIGVMVGCVFLAAVFTSAHRWKVKSRNIITTWKKSKTEKEHMEIFIGEEARSFIKKHHFIIYINLVCNFIFFGYVDTDMLKDVMRYSRQELEVACEDFSNIIGSSSDSVVYKGNMKRGPEIAVISLCNRGENWMSCLEPYFQKEVADLARLNHENVAKLLGYCIEGVPFTRMLVFEYASNGTLYEHLHCKSLYERW
ncbi:putative protein kinase RLK-Pelle-LRR-VI-2 family [Helianthus annuus]|nr:putative protein kinase RLK-Pelle-LRR-VI-2 family [Helianthus annuus]KAJ0736553.1 putative protein kinase RLK-Pelle-LRR-VI-2 family [Helianthus annuus]